MAAFYVLRLLMFFLSFVLEDWALHELLPVKRERVRALMLVASSYVTWTFQMHTFSNSIETLIVLWCLALMRRMEDDSEHTQVTLCVALAFLGVLGIFNRITFPAFIIVAGLRLVPYLWLKPLRLPIMLLAGGVTALIAIALDTEYYSGEKLHFRQIASQAVLTPYNNLVYNLNSANLAEHGLHPFFQHFAINLPQLIGPALPSLFYSYGRNTLFWSGAVGIILLSCFGHQEPRFLLPAVPLLLATVKLPLRNTRRWIGMWLVFNVSAAMVFGIFHQGGVVPVQAWIKEHHDIAHVYWWKTYSPPTWLLGERNHHVATTDLMGMPWEDVLAKLSNDLPCNRKDMNRTLLVAPSNSLYLDPVVNPTQLSNGVFATVAMYHRQHIGLDDLDFENDGVLATLQKVIGKRGLTVWELSKGC